MWHIAMPGAGAIHSINGATWLDLKAFGDRIAARDPDRQTAEIQIRIALMNRFSALGTPDILRVG